MKDQILSFDDLPKAVNQLGAQMNTIQRMLTQYLGCQQQSMQDHFLSVKEVATFLRLTVPTIYSKVSRGELPAMKQGNRLYFSLSELTKFLESGKKKSNAKIITEAEAYLSNNRKEVCHG